MLSAMWIEYSHRRGRRIDTHVKTAILKQSDRVRVKDGYFRILREMESVDEANGEPPS
jgi:hypothetical protein